jgi:hypothetical protein
MRVSSFLHGLVRTVAIVFALTILWSLGAAVFALLCGGLCWAFRVERAPFGVLWAATAGAIAGFLLGTLWAIDRAINWRDSPSPSQDDSRLHAMPPDDGKALRGKASSKLPEEAGADDGTREKSYRVSR